MQKLKYSVVDKMITSRLTKAEVDFILEISHYQNEKGKIDGVYYKQICDAIDISYQTFYVTMESLVNKGFISVFKSHHADWDIVIKGNDFSYPGAMKEGYINTGHDLFYNADFKHLKAGEKLLAMQFLKVDTSGGKYHAAVEFFFQRYSKILGVTRRTIQTYLTELKRFFKITLKHKMYWIIPVEECYKYNAPSDIKNFARHLGEVACRRNKASYTEREFNDTISLINQYIAKFGLVTGERFLKAVTDSIKLTNENLSKKERVRNLNPAFIHRLMIR